MAAFVQEKIKFLHDNEPTRSSANTAAKLVELQYTLLPHPPYSPDLVPSDFFLFPNLKKWLGGRRVSSNSNIINATNVNLEEFEKSYFLEELKKLERRWKKCIIIKRNYVKKQNTFWYVH